TLACPDAGEVWALPCFFIKAGWRDQGVAKALLAHALKSLRRRGAKIAEGYPVNLKPGQRLPNAFAWTGTRSIFAEAGFELAGPATTSKVRMRRRP
ncbi:MAG TPA: GNAT family N-acetyltransferase, partial [Steroidobacteraceae bacterium]|nr:GNAT family N-acetyltransferase [Steroidobacteraceae bacterium]